MPGMIGVFRAAPDQADRPVLLETIDLLGTAQRCSVDSDDGFLLLAWPREAPLPGARYIDNDAYLAGFSGDLVDSPGVPWGAFLQCVADGTYSALAAYSGNFAIAVLDKVRKCVILVADRRSQYPLFYYLSEGAFFFSTCLSTFCRLHRAPGFAPKWFYEHMFFNFPIQNRTFLEDVSRIPPAGVVRYNLVDCSLSISQYAPTLSKKDTLLTGQRSFDLAARVFQDRVPRYYQGAEQIACALTGGWDARTILALAPQPEKVTAYTYGLPGCIDLSRAAKVASSLKFRHRPILFDGRFADRLLSYMKRVLFLSSGLEKATRATLAYAYETLTESGRFFPLTLSGISVDMQFRGHAHSPPLVSADMARIFRTGDTSINEKFWSGVFGDAYSGFKRTTLEELEYLQDTFGDVRSGEHHLLYVLYLLGPKYFAGELELAGNFTTVRVPSWDNEITDLCLSVRESTLSFSEFTQHVRGGVDEIRLQAHILSTLAPRFAKLGVNGVRPDMVFRSKYIHALGRLCMLPERVRRLIRWLRSGRPRIERWNAWLNVEHRRSVDELIFSDEALIKEYVSAGFLRTLAQTRETHWVGKLVNVELLLRLIRNGWTL